MKKVKYQEIVMQTKIACLKMAYDLPEDVQAKLEAMRLEEDAILAQEMLDIIIENAKIARLESRPMCQDTGMVICFVKMGQDVQIEGGSIEAAINEGVALGYDEGFLRKSVVNNPIDRINTKNNTPAVVHFEVVEGDDFILEFAAKGFGSENMSQLKMFPPAAGLAGVKEFVKKVVIEAGPNACPPIIVGIGLGGTFEKCALMAKKAAIRSVADVNPNETLAQLEAELLTDINELGIGPQGFGGKTTCLKVNIEMYATHIAGLPVAVNINCHAARHVKVVF
ncbi:fumarate hydratase [Erysipelotrichaceae bacterium OttesenSCG-928-M19]|nr:fumarate hydratase [Erysipelotrichaceae bacterium OttesenSCG-928-M19]